MSWLSKKKTPQEEILKDTTRQLKQIADDLKKTALKLAEQVEELRTAKEEKL